MDYGKRLRKVEAKKQMILNKNVMLDKEEWQNKGYAMPQYDREYIAQVTMQEPNWIHFGAGNIFRAFPAYVVEKLLNSGKIDRGIIVAEGYDYDIIDNLNQKSDNLGIVVTLKSDGDVEKAVVGSVVESLVLDSTREMEFQRLREIFTKPSLQIASFTITEKGYNLVDGEGKMLDDVAKDAKRGVENPISYIGKVTALLYERFLCGELPLALVSMDNCSHNGDRLKEAILGIATQWVEGRHVDETFLRYLNHAKKVSYPWTMIDKITPRPHESIEHILEQDGISGVGGELTSKNTYIAPFVNTEECEYLVIEDWFPNGRPNLEIDGVYFTDRLTVDKVEKMKVCTCLNPLHTALAIFGCLLNYEKISDEMQDEALNNLVRKLGYEEGLPVVVNPEILSPREFIDQVVEKRIPNPFIPDTPQRIATDTSQKLAIRFGETIKAYAKSEELVVSDLKIIPLIQAGWIRYLMGIDDRGNRFELSPDPMIESLADTVEKLELGSNNQTHDILMDLISDEKIWGVDLYAVGLGLCVEGYFEELNAGVGAVRETLEKYCM